MEQVSTRADLESRLRLTAVRLVFRQAARTAVAAIAGGAAGVCIGVVFLELLPRLLFGHGSGVVSVALAALAGALLAAFGEVRRYRMPTLQDAALALESRLDSQTGAIASAIGVREGDPFFAVLLRRADLDLAKAERAPAPVLIRTRRLVLVPLLVLASGVACVVVISAEPPARPVEAVTGNAKELAGGWQGVDAGGSRGASDNQDLRHALGMTEAAATLNQSAAILRDAGASEQQGQNAVADARRALEGSGEAESGITVAEVADTLPGTQAGREALAAILEAAAARLAGAAARLENGDAGAADTGNAGDFSGSATSVAFVPFPILARSSASPADFDAKQTPARRELAQRAMQALAAMRDK